jgi:hypothetical protein
MVRTRIPEASLVGLLAALDSTAPEVRRAAAARKERVRVSVAEEALQPVNGEHARLSRLERIASPVRDK